MNKHLVAFLAVALLVGWWFYHSAPEPGRVEPSPETQKPPAGGAILTQANDQIVVSGMTVLHMQKFMLELCGITAADAPATFAQLKADEEKFQASMSAAARNALPGEYAKMEAKIKPEWDKSTAEERAKGCADIKAQAVSPAKTE